MPVVSEYFTASGNVSLRTIEVAEVPELGPENEENSNKSSTAS